MAPALARRTSSELFQATPQTLTKGVFAVIALRDTERLLTQLKIKFLDTGAVCCREGAVCKSVFIVLDGSLEVSRASRQGKTLIVNYVQQGDIVGELAALTERTRSATVRSVTPAVVGEMTLRSFFRCLNEMPDFSLYLMRAMAHRVIGLTEKAVDIATEDVPSRVLTALRALPPVFSQDPENAPRQRPTHTELARIVGTSREVVGRALHLLESAGEIRQDGVYVYLCTSARKV